MTHCPAPDRGPMLPAQRLPYWEYWHPQTPALVTVARVLAIGLKQRNCVGGFAALLGKGFSVFGVWKMLCIVPRHGFVTMVFGATID